jgi:hypothetical protein
MVERERERESISSKQSKNHPQIDILSNTFQLNQAFSKLKYPTFIIKLAPGSFIL